MTAANATDNNLITAMDAALRASITYAQVLRLIQTHRGLGCRRGRNWFVDPEALDSWKAEQAARSSMA